LNSDQDSDLQKYLDRSYWEQRNKTTEQTPPQITPTQVATSSPSVTSVIASEPAVEEKSEVNIRKLQKKSRFWQNISIVTKISNFQQNFEYWQKKSKLKKNQSCKFKNW